MTTPQDSHAAGTPCNGGQYSLGRILVVWALAAAPMGILGWVVLPALSPDVAADPLGAGVARLTLITLGLVWLFVLSLIIVRREEGDLRWTTIARRLRLHAPQATQTGQPRRALWLWLVPFLAGIAAWELVFNSALNHLWVSAFPILAEPPGRDFGAVFQSHAVLERLVGAWWFLALYVVSALFNALLGEEFLFRGILLPKMEGVFGKASWVANGVLFGVYHLHQPWGIPGSVVSGMFFYAFPAWRFRSLWMSAIIHSAQSVYFSFLILGAVLGLA